MQSEITTILNEIGLPEREAQVYLALLELGESTVLPIAQKAGLKRTYCYDILEALGKKGLVSYTERNNRRRYSGQDPATLQRILQERLQRFSDVLPELRSIYNQAEYKPKVRFYEGKEALLGIYEQLASVKEYAAITSPTQLYATFGDYFTKLGKRVAEKKVLARELVTFAATLPDYAEHFKKPLQEIRILPKGVSFRTDTLIFDNKLVLISYGQDIHAIVIESSPIVETQATLFNLIWGAVKPLVAV